MGNPRDNKAKGAQDRSRSPKKVHPNEKSNKSRLEPGKNPGPSLSQPNITTSDPPVSDKEHSTTDQILSPPAAGGDKPQRCQLQTNYQPIKVDGPVWMYNIECEPHSFLVKTEEKLLVQAFKDHFKLEGISGQFAFINSHSFLSSTEQRSLHKQTYVATLIRRPQKLDASFHKVFGKGEGNSGEVKWWSCITGGAIQQYPDHNQCIEPILVNPNDTCQCQTVYVSAKVAEVNFTNLLASVKEGLGSGYIIAATKMFVPPPVPIGTLNSNSTIVHGSKWFPGPGKAISLGLEYRAGIATEIKLAEVGLMRATIPCYRIFYQKSMVSDFIEYHFPRLEMPSDIYSPLLSKILRGLKIRIIGRDPHARLATITGVSVLSVTATMFNLTDEGDRSISVADYFMTHKGISITHTDQPCINVGSQDRPQYIPSSICEIIAGQSFRHSVPENAQAQVNNLKESLYKAPDASDFFKQSSLGLIRKQVTNFGNLSLAPLVPLDVPSWKLSKKASAAPVTANIHQYFEQYRPQIFVLEVGSAAETSQEVSLLMMTLNNILQEWNATLTVPLKSLRFLDDARGCRAAIGDAVKLTRKDDPRADRPVVLSFISDDIYNKFNYQSLKKIFDIELGYHNCCINIGQLKKRYAQDQCRGISAFAARLLRQIQAKSITHECGEGETLLLGAHVARVAYNLKNLEDSAEVFLIALASKPAGGGRNFRSTVKLQKISNSEPIDFQSLVRKHIDGNERGKYSRVIFCRSGFIANAAKKPHSLRSQVYPLSHHVKSQYKDIEHEHGNQKCCNNISNNEVGQEATKLNNGPIKDPQKFFSFRGQPRSKKDSPSTDSFDSAVDSKQLVPSSQTSQHGSESGEIDKETDPAQNHIAREVAQLKELFTVASECEVDLIYLSVDQNTKLRLYDVEGQPIAKVGQHAARQAFHQTSYVIHEGINHPSKQDCFMQKELRGNTNMKPLHLTSFEGAKAEDNWREAFETLYDYPTGVSGSKAVAPIHFARLAAKRALLYMRHDDYESETAPYSLLPVHDEIKNTLYYI